MNFPSESRGTADLLVNLLISTGRKREVGDHSIMFFNTKIKLGGMSVPETKRDR